MRELLARAKQAAEKIIDEAVKNALLVLIKILEKKVEEFILDVDDDFLSLEELQTQLDEIPTIIKTTQKTIDETVLTDTDDIRSKRGANAILKQLLESGVKSLQDIFNAKRNPAANNPQVNSNTKPENLSQGHAASAATVQPNSDSLFAHELFAKRLRSVLDEQLDKLDLVEQEEVRLALKKVLEVTKQTLMVLEKMLQKKINLGIVKLISEQSSIIGQKFQQAYGEFTKRYLIDKTKVDTFQLRLLDSIHEAIEIVFKLPSELSLQDLQQQAKDRVFDENLAQLQAKLKQLKVQSPSCFVSYAWGNAVNESIVHTLAERMLTAGINVVLDIWHNRVNSITQFVQRIYKEDFVLVVGSSLLKQKYDNPGPYGSYVQQELDNILVRIKERQDKQKYPKGTGIIKALIEAPYWNAFPDLFKPYPLDEADFTNKLFYYEKFFNLLSLLYANSQLALEEIKKIKVQFESENKELSQLSIEELKGYLNKEPSAQERAAVQQSVRDKLQKISTNRAGFFAPVVGDGASAAATLSQSYDEMPNSIVTKANTGNSIHSGASGRSEVTDSVAKKNVFSHGNKGSSVQNTTAEEGDIVSTAGNFTWPQPPGMY